MIAEPTALSPVRRALARPGITPLQIAFVAILGLAAALRAVALGHLNFREDEGFSLTYARQSWAGVLGFHGFYDFHPPLDFSLAKLAGLVVPELLASRTVSALAAIATFPIFFALVTRLLDARAALLACGVLALAPAHVEFSRVGRMYAPVTFAVACTYLAIVAYAEEGRRRWLALYAGAIALALYLDYSAVYALLPQAELLLLLLRQQMRRAVGLIVAGFVGVLLYTPWLTQLPGTVRLANAYSRRTHYLDASPSRVLGAIPELLGLAGGGSTRHATWPNLWLRWPDWHWLLLLALAPAVVVGGLALRRRPFALVVALCLGVGTPATAIVLSQISAGWAARTVLPCTLGWALLIGAGAARVSLPRLQRIAGLASAAFLVVSSLNALPAIYSNVGRSLRYDEAARTLVAAAPLDFPVMIYSTGGMDTDVIEAMAGSGLDPRSVITVVDGELEPASAMSRWLARGPSRLDVAAGKLPTILQPVAGHDEAIWFVTHRPPDAFDRAFAALGYTRLLDLNDAHLVLELLAKPDAEIGAPIAINGAFAGQATTADGWNLPTGATLRVAGTGRALSLPAGTNVDAARVVDGIAPGIYAVSATAAGDPSATLTLKCRSAAGKTLATGNATAKAAAASGDAVAPRAAVLCPAGTTALAVILSVSHGNATFSGLQLAGTALIT